MLFSVIHNGEGGYQYKEIELVELNVAMETFFSLVMSPAARLGIIKRIIIIDAEDFTNLEWTYEKGVTFPPELEGHFRY